MLQNPLSRPPLQRPINGARRPFLTSELRAMVRTDNKIVKNCAILEGMLTFDLEG